MAIKQVETAARSATSVNVVNSSVLRIESFLTEIKRQAALLKKNPQDKAAFDAIHNQFGNVMAVAKRTQQDIEP